MNNYEVFERFLESKNLHMEKVRDNNCVFFRTEQRTDNGANVVIVTSFYDNSDIIEIEIYNLAKLTNPLKEDKFLCLLNELNRSSRFTKYILNSDNYINVFYCYVADKDFTMESAERVFETIIHLLRAAEESYPKFMKLQWA